MFMPLQFSCFCCFMNSAIVECRQCSNFLDADHFSCQLIRQLSHFIAFFCSISFVRILFLSAVTVYNRKISTCQACFFLAMQTSFPHLSFRYKFICACGYQLYPWYIHVYCCHCYTVGVEGKKSCTIYFKSINSQIDCSDS